MRIANVVGAGPFWERLSERLAEEAAHHGAELVPYPVHYPPGRSGRVHPISRIVYDVLNLEVGLRAYEDGCDAIFVNTFADYGMEPLRASVSVPVMNAGETAMALSRTIGESFSIVTPWPPGHAQRYRSLLTTTGMDRYCASITHAFDADELAEHEIGPHVYGAIDNRDPDLIDRLEAACQRAFDGGAEVAILGCTCLHPIAGEILSRFDLPVLDAVTVGLRTALLAAELVPGKPGDTHSTADDRAALRSILSDPG